MINVKIEKDVKLTVDKLILSVVENSSPVITTTNNNDTETIDFNVDGSSSKEAHEKEKRKGSNMILFLKWISYSKLNLVSRILT